MNIYEPEEASMAVISPIWRKRDIDSTDTSLIQRYNNIKGYSIIYSNSPRRKDPARAPGISFLHGEEGAAPHPDAPWQRTWNQRLSRVGKSYVSQWWTCCKLHETLNLCNWLVVIITTPLKNMTSSMMLKFPTVSGKIVFMKPQTVTISNTGRSGSDVTKTFDQKTYYAGRSFSDVSNTGCLPNTQHVPLDPSLPKLDEIMV